LLLEPTKFTPLDLAASLGLTHVASKYATLDDSFRLTIYKDANGDAPAWSDLRFIGGVSALLINQLHADEYHPLVKKACHDISVGLLSSFVSTETCRAVAVKRMAESYQVSGDEMYDGSTNVYIEEESESSWSDDPNLEDIYGNDQSYQEEQVSYAYGW